ncbi:hypothetical protein PtA15_2A22 [Puccinia triticina]|uniref:Uncharacterized protein n=1 Tax=Puccinia triticina TaxID=208348 RepID=A0ABY7C965_9BASI|nr:uncharacterized protein PtA15_2A22 [Puccinia triticina]WAQ81711.1 hypothetical protein PtA15_2A22 [Puccinia triticina]
MFFNGDDTLYLDTLTSAPNNRGELWTAPANPEIAIAETCSAENIIDPGF